MIDHRLVNIKTDKFTLHFFNSMTNIKIIILTSTEYEVGDKLNRVYKLYSELLRNDWRYMVY